VSGAAAAAADADIGFFLSTQSALCSNRAKNEEGEKNMFFPFASAFSFFFSNNVVLAITFSLIQRRH
jgi:hypothetical protein